LSYRRIRVIARRARHVVRPCACAAWRRGQSHRRAG